VPEGSPIAVPFEQQDVDDLLPEHRPRPRRFTIREWDERTQTLVIDFVVHGDAGYAGSWAQRAKPGARLQFQGPGGSYRPSPEADWHLLVGDESAFGAIGASLQSLASTAHAVVFALVERPGSEIEFPSSANVAVNWLYREEASNAETVLVDAVRSAVFPIGDFDVFVHGEAGEVRALRQHLVDDRRVDPDSASISAYWRRNHTDEDWRKVKRGFMASPAT
jgi:NADPH-dependent ferric siderophore reductase